MKLTFKDLKQQKFVIEAEPSETIGDVKAKISAEKGWEPSLQKLIYSGKILQDANTVESYNIEEKGFIVCMVQKPKTAPSPASKATPSTPAPATAQAPSTPAAPAPAPAPASADVPATPSPAPAAAPQTTGSARFDDPSTLTMGSEREAAIANMESMGFARADIDRAMRAAFFNPDRAVEYLLTGIPESALRDQNTPQAPPAAAAARGATSPPPAAGAGATTQPASGGDAPLNLFEAAAQAGRGGRGATGARSGATAATAGTGAAAGAGAGAGAALGAGNLEFLRNNREFQQLRQVVQQQPQMLEPILQQVGAGNPQLAQLIASHPEQFLQLLSEEGDEDTRLPAQTITVTEEEREAIERANQVIQAYFACDKNEELAANFLFDQPDDEGDS
ncbi:UV excision repair protein rad23 [Coniosporium tulheliwenetii]|uniref:UV excision repair protein rad23 n=1 Tax=Coniosporium tulheliwenetii TaxID=3383036 RepID=A0ACC2Z2Q5_9PEZI|nr:UV excision repair protein rad23 [Cladosporium sp. JES 115]